jgi:signal transduction histidine kinase
MSNSTGSAGQTARGELRTGSGSRILGYWGILLILFALLLGPEATFTFGSVCFGGLILVWLKEWNSERGEPFYLANGAMLVLCTIWFVTNLLESLLAPQVGGFLVLSLAFLFPPLIAHLSYLEAARAVESKRWWKLFVVVHYPISIAGCVGVWILLLTGSLDAVTVAFPLAVLVMFALLFGSVGTFSYFMHKQIPAQKRSQGKAQIRTNILLYIGTVVIFFSLVLAMAGGFYGVLNKLGWMSRALPLVFLFANSYYENRFAFFDIFVKRATLFYVALAGLMLYFRVIPRAIESLGVDSQMQPAAYVLTLVPLVLTLPWAYTKIGVVLDRFWLGRSFNTVEAVKFFLEGIQSATTSAELSAKAESRLAEIFKTQARVQLRGRDSEQSAFEVAQAVRIPAAEGEGGTIFFGPRFNQAPYFAQDLKLIEALANVFSHMLQNILLQEKKQEQEIREQGLILDASRSELKALRAQVNPHFLFNALNAIASLTHRNPAQAEETVEQLAEVFRYTLSRSEKEWVRVSEEIDFIRAYLEVEKARYGKRLEVNIGVEKDVEELQVPSMMIQILVENAVKHGISAVKGRARVGIEIEAQDSFLEIRVSDNGPGFRDDDPGRVGRKQSGYGLKNIRGRLKGYYEDRASLRLERLKVEGLTVATVRIPIEPGFVN